jgi:holo-[acyl-carrier protein] synthase
MAKASPEGEWVGRSGSIRVGVDLLPVARMARLAAENPGIHQAVFTDEELRSCLGKRRTFEHLAARFAAKEAVLKALGTGLGRRMRWTDVEIVSGPRGRPAVRLHGEVAAWARRGGLAELDVSLSHTSDLAMAQAVAVWTEPRRAGGGEGGVSSRALPSD